MLVDLLAEYAKLQAEFPQLQNVPLAFVDDPGNLTYTVTSPITGKKIICRDCAGLFTVTDGMCKIEVCKHESPVYQLLILLHESRHAIKYKSGAFQGEGPDEEDADRFMSERFLARFNGRFPRDEVIAAIETHKNNQLGNACKRNFNYDTSIINGLLATLAAG